MRFAKPALVVAFAAAVVILALVVTPDRNKFCPPGGARAATIGELSAEIPRWMEQCGIPGLAIAVIEGGKITWAEGFGITSADDPDPVTGDTVFEAASLSKPVFTLAYLKLAEERGFDLDRPLAETFTYARLADDPRAANINPRLILSHRSGLPNWDREGTLDLDRAPGERYGYSGEGFVYLQRYVEALTGQTLHEFADARVFTPLGMERSGFVWKEDFASSFAEGHGGEGEVRPSARYEEGNAAYSLMTTAPDYARFLIAVMEGGGLAEDTFRDMLTPHTRMTGAETRTRHPREVWGKIAWGLSWGIQENEGRTIFWHWGDNDTYRCFAAFNREAGNGFVYFTNSHNGLYILNRVAAPIVGDMRWTEAWLGYTPPEVWN